MIDAKSFPGRGQVAILRTRPETVLDDYDRLMQLCQYEQNLPQANDTLLKSSVAWHIWFPACSTAPWQLDGVIRALLRDGYAREKLIALHADTDDAGSRQGARNNRHALIQDHYGIHELQTNQAGVEWTRYEPTQPFAALDQMYPQGVYIPKAFYDKNVLHLPTMKTDAFTLVAGAMQNAYDGLWNAPRHWTRANRHDALVDLLQIQQDVHSGIFCVMDGTFAGEGPGPRALRPHVKNTILASSDPVALDAVSAKIMGIDPLRVRFIRHAHERGLGVGNPKEIKIIGDVELANENWHFEHDGDTFASWSEKQFERERWQPLLRSPFGARRHAASRAYHNLYWYPFVGARRAELALDTAWGKKYLQYSEGLPFNPGAADRTRLALLIGASVAAVAVLGVGAYLATQRGKARRAARHNDTMRRHRRASWRNHA